MSAGAPLLPLSEGDRVHFEWLETPALRKVIAALEAVKPDGARFVGGCVRDSLLGAAPKDFDIATPLRPEAAMAALKHAGVRVAPTGLAHGTVTAIVDHMGVEVTSLRADVSTDGRRATVAFTDDWATDAARRDFTLNAIYLTADGHIYDPVGGVADARARQVRFIGAPTERIREDYLRILRFFRFSTRFARSFDDDGLRACAAEKAGLAVLSAERIGGELSQILNLPNAVMAVDGMARIGVLEKITEADADLVAFRRLKEMSPDAPFTVGLAVLFGENGAGLGARLRLSNDDNARRRNAIEAAGAIHNDVADKDARALIYRVGNRSFEDGALMAAACDGIDQSTYERLSTLSRGWPAPALPVSGKDALAAGLRPGPQISSVLKQTEAEWVREDFPDATRARAILNRKIRLATR